MNRSKSVMVAWTVFHEINHHININVLKYFENKNRTELGFTVVVPRGDDRCEKKTNKISDNLQFKCISLDFESLSSFPFRYKS